MTDKAMPAAPITQRSTASIGFVIVIITGIVANVGMMFTLKGEVALVNNNVDHVAEDTREIRTQLSAISNESRSEIGSLRTELATIRERMLDLSARTGKLENP